MAVNLAQIKDLLMPGLYKLTGDYDQIPRRWDKIFTTKTSTLAIERSVQMRMFGLAQYKSEGAAVGFDNGAGQRYVYNAETQEVALAFAITRKAIDDNKYKSEFNPSVGMLNNSFAQFKETLGADILNSATTYDSNIGGDGKALCATDHPVDGSTFANKPTTEMNLNEASLLTAQVAVRTDFVNEAGLKIYAMAKTLVIPPQLEATAVRLTKTELRPGTANNDVNAIRSVAGGLPGGYIVNEYLTSAYAWFLTTNIEGLIHMKRKGYETDMQVDFHTDNLLVKGYERYCFTYNDPRCIYGSFPTS